MIDSMKQIIVEMLMQIKDEQAVLQIYAVIQEIFLDQE